MYEPDYSYEDEPPSYLNCVCLRNSWQITYDHHTTTYSCTNCGWQYTIIITDWDD